MLAWSCVEGVGDVLLVSSEELCGFGVLRHDGM